MAKASISHRPLSIKPFEVGERVEIAVGKNEGVKGTVIECSGIRCIMVKLDRQIDIINFEGPNRTDKSYAREEHFRRLNLSTSPRVKMEKNPI